MSKRVLVSAVMACAATAAQAQSTVFAVDLRANPNRLLSFPSNAPANTSIATTPYDGFAIDFNGGASALYGITAAPAGGQILGTINTTSGAFSNVAAVNGAIAGITNYGGMSFDSSSGTMYVLASAGAVSSIYTLNLATATLTLVAPVIGGPANALYIDMAIDNAGNAYLHDIATDVMLSVNKATGVATTLGATGFNANFAQGMDFDPVTNVLYAAIYTGGGTGAYCSINTTTGAATSIVSTTPWNAEMEMAIAPAPGAAALLGLAGLMASRRRR